MRVAYPAPATPKCKYLTKDVYKRQGVVRAIDIAKKASCQDDDVYILDVYKRQIQFMLILQLR